jgi:transcriptional regulator with XRE-family HTH domain
MAQFHSVLHERRLKANYLLIQNVRALLAARGVDDKALAMFCGHKPAWLSKIMAGERGICLPDLDKVADFFGLTAAQLLSHGISPLTERRKGERRTADERRQQERRRTGLVRLHREMPPFANREYLGGNNDGNEDVM